MRRRIYVTSWGMVDKVEQMLRNTGRIPDWDLATVRIARWGFRVEW